MSRQEFSRIHQLWSGAAAAAFIAGAVNAEPASESMVLEEVIVTAQKRSERLLDVPVPVTAMDSESLIQQNLVKIEDYATRVPGLQVGGDRIYLISLRGVDSFGGSATTAVTVDDVPFVPSAVGAQGIFPNFDPGDLARIEVLRGPQGTLYGAAAMGGLIKYVPKEPDPGSFSGRLEAGYNQMEHGGEGNSLRGSANIPLWQDKLALRVSGFRREDPAYTDRIAIDSNGDFRVTRKDVDDFMVDGGRAAVLFRPVDNLTINASYMKQTREATGGGATDITSYPTDFKPIYGYYTTTAGETEFKDEHELTQLRVDWDLPFGTLTSSSGWVQTGGIGDIDVTSSFPFIFFPLFPGTPIYPDSPPGSQARIINSTQTDKFSQELRLASSGEGRLEWLIGGFYTDEDIDLFQDLKAFAPGHSLIGDVIIFPNHYTLREKAVFGSMTWHFTDRFNVEVGGRYSENEQTSRASQVVAPAAVPVFQDSFAGPVLRSSEDAVTWLVSPQYRINDDVMVYGRVATGYRPGGPNDAFAPNPTYDSDSLTNYELGLKGQLFDRRLTIDASVFDIEWEDIQLSVYTPTLLNYTVNASKARIRGVEAAVQWIPASGWLISANAAFNDAELRDDFPTDPSGGPTTLAFKGDSLPRSARFSGNLGVEKTWGVFSDYRLTLGANLSHVGDRAIGYRSSSVLPAQQPRYELPSYEVVDAYATVTNGTWNANFYVRNLGGEHGVLGADDRGGAVETMQGSFIAPQTVGMTLSWNF